MWSSTPILYNSSVDLIDVNSTLNSVEMGLFADVVRRNFKVNLLGIWKGQVIERTC